MQHTQVAENPIEKGRAAYFAQRQENEIDVVQEVREILRLSGFTKPALDLFDSDPTIINARDKNAFTQRYLLNRYWTLQLQSTPVNSEQARYFLLPEGEVTEWLRCFKTVIVPFALENNLPISLHG